MSLFVENSFVTFAQLAIIFNQKQGRLLLMGAMEPFRYPTERVKLRLVVLFQFAWEHLVDCRKELFDGIKALIKKGNYN